MPTESNQIRTRTSINSPRLDAKFYLQGKSLPFAIRRNPFLIQPHLFDTNYIRPKSRSLLSAAFLHCEIIWKTGHWILGG